MESNEPEVFTAPSSPKIEDVQGANISESEKPAMDLPQAPAGYGDLFSRCKQVIQQRTDKDQTNAQLKLFLRRLCNLIQTSETLTANELSDAQREMDLKMQDFQRESAKLKDSKENLAMALTNVVQNFNSITAADPDFLATYPHMKCCLQSLVLTRDTASAAQMQLNTVREHLDLAQKRFKAMQSKHEIEQRIKHIQSRIDSNLGNDE